MDAFCRLIGSTPDRLGLSRFIYLRLTGRKHRSVQFGTGDDSTGKGRLSPVMCVLFATLGNTIGGMTCYYMGRLGNVVWIEKYFKVKKEKVDKMQTFLQGKGALMGFFRIPALRGRSNCHCAGFHA